MRGGSVGCGSAGEGFEDRRSGEGEWLGGGAGTVEEGADEVGGEHRRVR